MLSLWFFIVSAVVSIVEVDDVIINSIVAFVERLDTDGTDTALGENSSANMHYLAEKSIII